MSDITPAKDRAGHMYPALRGERLAAGTPNVDRGTQAQALLWLLRHGHRDIAVMLGLLPAGGGEQ